MKEWFLTNYANYSENPVFDENGFVIVKTKAQMEQEAKEATANSNVRGGTDTESAVNTKTDNETKDANESGSIITTFVNEDSEDESASGCGGTISVAA